MIAQTKLCSRCLEEKPRSEYYIDRRGTPRGRCKACCSHVYKSKYQQDTGKYKRRSEEYRKKNPERYHQCNRDLALRRNYGITLEQYDLMYHEQEGACGLCGREDPKLMVDHCHDTNKIRGLLCRSCNTGLGSLGDDIPGLERAIMYLKGFEFESSLG